MKFFSGFCLCNEKNLFKEFLQESEFCIAGFSYGAQKAIDYALNSNKRIDKIQLLSPAFFDYNKKIIDLNLKAFEKNKNRYIKNFLTKAGINEWELENANEVSPSHTPNSQNWMSGKQYTKYVMGKIENGKWKIKEKNIKICECSEKDLYKLFTFEWEKIKQLKNIKIEVFLGEYDKIVSVEKAYRFFKNHADVYLIKKANHFLRR